MAEHHHEGDNPNHSHEGEHHIVSIPLYLTIFGVLVVGTILTVLVALMDLDHLFFPGANTLVALLIAFVKMTCVVLWFMHVKYSSRLIWLTVLSGFFWLAIMFAFTMQDYLTRGHGLFTR
jgi:cytochrome c oxidase subunit 4